MLSKRVKNLLSCLKIKNIKNHRKFRVSTKNDTIQLVRIDKNTKYISWLPNTKAKQNSPESLQKWFPVSFFFKSVLVKT